MKTLHTLVLCLFLFSLQAQNYYYNGNEKVEILKSDKSFISYDKPTQTFAKGFKNVNFFSTKGFTILEDKQVNFSAKELKKHSQTTPALLLNSSKGFKMFPTKTIRVKLRANKKKEDILKLFESNDIIKIENKYGILRLKIKDINKVLEIANKIYEADIAEFSIPDFYIPIELNQVNDPLFSQQFQMHNTGQTIDGVAGVNDIDVNALEAWDISLGDNTTVAVIDQGLENHEDLGNRLIGGFTPVNNGNGVPVANNDTHGMNCAGVIAASDDNLGVRGVSPNSNLLGVNIFAGGETTGDIADGIIWAVNNGADVLSNSWGYNSCTFSSADIDNAIQFAVTSGRNGLGTLVIFSAGNNGGCVQYPARNPNVIAVGAIDNQGNQFNYSARGIELDLVAPSGQTNYLGNIRTLDRMGNTGRLPGHYEDSFGGTSASCPVVSGVAALVLSVNSNLTQQEVTDILLETSTDMGVNGFDNNFGHGRVNALRAVEEALYGNLTISGNDIVCNSNSFYSLSQVLNGVTVSWSVSSNLQIVNSSSTGATVRAINNAVQGNGFISATVGTRVITQNMWIGKPKAFTTYPDPTICTNVFVQPNPYSLPASPGASTYGLTSNSPYLFVDDFATPNIDIFIGANLAGNYTITLTTTNPCGSSQATIYVTAQQCGGVFFRTYPNPTDNNFTIKKLKSLTQQKTGASARSLKTSAGSFELYNFSSDVVLSGELKESTNIDVSTLKKGAYILKIHANGNTETHQIIVQ